jgi:voltage-gated potassium channel
LKAQVNDALNVHDRSGRGGRVLGWLMIGLILLSVAAVIVESVQELDRELGQLLDAIELGTVLVFTLEYMLRVWSCVAEPGYEGAVTGRLRFMGSPASLADLLAVLPFYLTPEAGGSMVVLRLFRMLRLVRGLKLVRYSSTLRLFGRVVYGKREELTLALLLDCLLIVLAAALIYLAEHDAQPASFSSIPACMWWAVITLTTVGYGDLYPVTALGKSLTAVFALTGVGLIALPAGILASGFLEEASRARASEGKCPTCGRGPHAAG